MSSLFSSRPRDTDVCEKNTPPDRKTCGKTSFWRAKSGAGKQFLLLDCRAQALQKGVFLFTDTGMSTRGL